MEQCTNQEQPVRRGRSRSTESRELIEAFLRCSARYLGLGLSPVTPGAEGPLVNAKPGDAKP